MNNMKEVFVLTDPEIDKRWLVVAVVGERIGVREMLPCECIGFKLGVF